jgi:dTDP-glucose 4,6-dehydratase
MNLFVAGGAGFIGSNFVHLALERGHAVLNYDALTYAGNLGNLTGATHSSFYRFMHGNILDGNLVRQTLEAGFGGKPFDVCINFAAESHVDRSIDAARLFTETNVLGTVALLEAARAAAVPMFIQISTDEVYGSIEDKKKFTRVSPLKPSSPYSASKAAADLLALSFYTTHGYDVRITRCSNNYGRFQYPEKFIPTIITRTLQGSKIPVYGDGRQVRDWIFVEDHCEGVFSTIEHGKPGGVYLFGGSSEERNLDLAYQVLSAIGQYEHLSEGALDHLIEFVTDRPGHDRRYAIDWSSSEQELGWKPTTNFKEGLHRTVIWYLENRKWWEQLLSK